MKDLLKFDCRIIFAVIISVFCLMPQNINAAPAYPYPVEYKLPDGSDITILLKGDEFVHWRESVDGYTILVNSEGFLEYAEEDENGNLKLSGVRANNENRRNDNEKAFLQKSRRGLRYSPSQTDDMRRVYKSKKAMIDNYSQQQRTIQLSGEARRAVILVDFPGTPFTKSKEEFQMLFDQLDYTETEDGSIPGSLRDYYKQNSYGKLDLRVDVFGPFRMPNSVAYYGGRSGNENASEMARAAVDAAEAAGMNFANYPDPVDGRYAAAVHIIFAGYGMESGAANTIWSHAWGFEPVVYDEKWVTSYSCSPELRGIDGQDITHIGVVAHELGHSLLYLPDFYDTDYQNPETGGQAVDIGSWDIMATGGWNDNGRTPALFSAYSRVACGWATEVPITEAQNITIPNPHLDECIVYRIDTKTAKEYYLLENRQQIGWDAGIPGSGLMVYHVDKNNGGWSEDGIGVGPNTINANPNRRGYYVKQAGCTNTNGCDNIYDQDGILIEYYDRGTDPFPQEGKNSITDNTTPNMKSIDGANTEKPIINITLNKSDNSVSFYVGGEGKITPPSIIFPSAEAVTYSSTQTLSDIALTGGTTGRGTFAWKNPETVPQVNNNGYEVEFIPDDDDIYDYTGINLSKTIDLNIIKADYYMSGISFESRVFTFDGEEHSLSISGTLADGITVEYTGNGQTEIGVYEVEAVFSTTDLNYNTPEKMYATLTITAPVSIVDIQKSNGRFGIKFTQNPVLEKAEINIILPDNEKSAETKITIYDMTGNIVYQGGFAVAPLTPSPAKPLGVVWDLCNKSGRFVANGTYLVVAEIKGQSGQVYRYSAKLGVKR